MATVSRRFELLDMGVTELVSRLLLAESENERLRNALRLAFCGSVLDPTTTCQLPRGHEGCHAWQAHDSHLIVKWG